ncbi:amidohydrolase family protein [Candidatus Latescibacterota bacterium]
MKKILLLAVNVLVLYGCANNSPSDHTVPPSRPLVFVHANLIDMTNAAPKVDMTLVIIGNRIVKIGKSDKVKIPKDAQIVDVTEKFLIPGLWDMHVHIFDNVSAPGTNNKDNYFPLFLANGVTGVRDMFTDVEDIKLVREWKSELEAGQLLAPRIAPGSSIIDGVPVIQKNSVGVSNADEARKVVRTFKEAGAGYIKIYSNLSRESFFAIADESKKLKIPFAGHVPVSVTPVEASNAGQKCIDHLKGMLLACSTNQDKLFKIRNTRGEQWTLELFIEMMQSYSEQKCRDIANVFVRNKTWHDPTLVVLRKNLSDDENIREDARLRYVPADKAQRWKKYTGTLEPASRKDREMDMVRWLEILKIMHEEGVQILAGTDVGNPYIYAGFSLHDELELYIQAGFTPFEALETATINPAKYLGMEKSLGTIEEGKIADLVLLDADPLANISNTRKIHAVILNGRLLDRTTLNKMLAEVEAEVNKK